MNAHNDSLPDDQSPRAASEAAAISVARRVYRDVPGYRAFVDAAGVDMTSMTDIDDFRRLPQMTKNNYLTRYSVPERMWHGDAAGALMWSTSSGSSGTPTYFPRDDRAIAYSARVFDRMWTDNFGSKARSTLVIVSFALGNWIAGTYTLQGLQELPRRGHRLSVITPGMQTADILDAMKVLGGDYDQIVLVGYPPFIKDVLDEAPPEVRGLDIKLQLAGDVVTEAWRDHILARLGREGEPERICSIYGTADAGVMGYETPTSIAIRRATVRNKELRAALYGEVASVPTFCEVDADQRYVEMADGHLLFTIDTAMPLIRYRTNDRGWPVSGILVRRMLNGHGLPELAEQVNPASTFVVLTGRSDVAANFYSAGIFDANLRPVFDHPTVTPAVSGKFVISKEFDVDFNEVLNVHVELKKEATMSDGLRSQLTNLCYNSLRDTNPQYRELDRVKGEVVRPKVILHGFRSQRFLAERGKHRSVETTEERN